MVSTDEQFTNMLGQKSQQTWIEDCLIPYFKVNSTTLDFVPQISFLSVNDALKTTSSRLTRRNKSILVRRKICVLISFLRANNTNPLRNSILTLINDKRNNHFDFEGY
jgi:hypothetical protein